MDNTTKDALQFGICTQYGIKQYLPENNKVLMSQQVLSIFFRILVMIIIIS